MSHTPLMLSALATSAVPGFHAVSAQQVSTAERSAALVHDVQNDPWLVELPRTDADQELHSSELQAARALTEGLRSRLPFALPQLAGVTEVQGRTLSVTRYLPGQALQPKGVTPVGAASMGNALAAIHSLPVGPLADHGRVSQSALDTLRESSSVVDATASTGLLPQSLLRRWETACEDAGLWQFEATVIHGICQLPRFLMENQQVVAMDQWQEFRRGDPAKDLSWLTTPANNSFAQNVHTAYRSARGSSDRWIMQRARLYAELDIARWLLHGVALGHDSIIRDATDMLSALNDRVSGDLESAITQPITQSKDRMGGNA